MNKFKSDHNHLLNYCIKHIAFFTISGCVLLVIRKDVFDFDFDFDISNINIMFFCSTFFLWGYPSAILHNCAHKNVKPNWLNTVLGEVIGSFMLYGFRGFRLGHLFHHKFPDNPDWDPHPPRGYNFLQFVMAPVKDTLKVIEKGYYESFGNNERTVRSIRIQTVLFYLSGFCRLFFWICLFKLEGFIFFYLPAYIGNIIVFAHINFATHIERKDGSCEIVNLNGNIYYRVINKLSFNGYYHKSHHRKPQFFNPKKAKIDDSVPYVSYKGQ